MNKHHDIDQLIQALPAATLEILLIDDEAMIAADSSMQKQNMSTTLKIVSVIGGLLSSLAFIGFIFISGIFDSEIILITFSLIMIAVAILLHKRFKQILVDTISISLFNLGCCLLIFGMQALNVSETFICFSLITIAIITIIIVYSFLLALSSILLIAGATLWLIARSQSTNLFYVYEIVMAIAMYVVYIHEAWFICSKNRIGTLFEPLLPALIVALAGGFIFTTTESLYNMSPLLAPFPAVVCW